MSDELAIRIAEGVLTVGQAVGEYLNGLDDKLPSRGSIAQRERESKYGNGVIGIDFALGLIWVTVGVASDHLQAANRLMLNRAAEVSVHRYAVFSVLRVAMEVGGLSWWLARSDIGPRERVGRSLRLAEYSRRLRDQSDRLTSPPNDDSYLESMRANIEQAAADHNLAGLVAKLKAGKKVSIPKARDLVTGLYGSIEGINPGDAVSIYSMLSEFMHGNMLGSVAGFRRATPLDLNQQVLHPYVPIAEIALGAHYASVGVAAAFGGVVTFMGWDANRWYDLTAASIHDLAIAAAIAKNLDEP